MCHCECRDCSLDLFHPLTLFAGQRTSREARCCILLKDRRAPTRTKHNGAFPDSRSNNVFHQAER